MRNSRNDSRGDRRGSGQGRGGNRGGRGRGGHRGGRGGRHRDPRMAAEGGNKRERIAVESGYLVLIDQFMLANPQFISKLAEVMDQEPEAKDKIVSSFGGVVIELEPGTYRIDRDPFEYIVAIYAENESVGAAKGLRSLATQSRGDVFVDTRCLAMIDRELLDDSELLQKYQQLWFSGQDKACRDLLRDNGGAVRYGFQRYGDELQVYSIPGKDVVCLWPNPATLPTQVESTASSSEEAGEGLVA
jgi:hypothetical protein